MADDLAKRAKKAGLRHIEAASLCLKRKKTGRGFSYVDGRGRPVRKRDALDRIEAIVIPPAWVDVCIADRADAHIQATGRDAEGRLQYRYHSDWTAIRDADKGERLLRFGAALPKIRACIERDLRRRKTDRRHAAAVAARLIDRALLRSGHDAGSIDDGGRGATTLLKRDVKLNGTKVFLNFTGKGGKLITRIVRDPTLLSRLRRLKAIGKKRLFAFRDERGGCSYLSARDLNAWLRSAAGAPVTAKDFRTFAASAQALAALCEAERPESDRARKSAVATIMRDAAEKLANTPAVARSSYVHPTIVSAFDADALDAMILKGPCRQGLDTAETALMRFLESAEERRPATPQERAR